MRQFQLLTFPHYVFWTIFVSNLPYTFLWGPRSSRIICTCMSKLAAQMVTSTPLENLSLHLYESQNKNFNFGTTKTSILHARSIFFKGVHLTKIWSKKIFFMKTLSKLGALTVYIWSEQDKTKTTTLPLGHSGKPYLEMEITKNKNL